LLGSEEVNKILALWVNSTFGALLLFSIAEVTEGAWVGFKKKPLSRISVIDMSKLTMAEAKTLLNLYDEVRLQELKPLPEEFAKPNVKKKIDDAFNHTSNIKAKLDDLYTLLAHDPTITGQPLK